MAAFFSFSLLKILFCYGTSKLIWTKFQASDLIYQRLFHERWTISFVNWMGINLLTISIHSNLPLHLFGIINFGGKRLTFFSMWLISGRSRNVDNRQLFKYFIHWLLSQNVCFHQSDYYYIFFFFIIVSYEICNFILVIHSQSFQCNSNNKDNHSENKIKLNEIKSFKLYW